MQKPIAIYTKTTCPFCHATKALLDDLKLSYDETVVDNQPDLRQKLAEENNGYRTVPMVFIDGEFIGGNDDLQALHARGGLLPKAGVA